MENRLPQRIKEILRIASQIGDNMGIKVYCVGGFVRDLLLSVQNFDVDLVVEGDGLAFAGQLAQELGGRIKKHQGLKLRKYFFQMDSR